MRYEFASPQDEHKIKQLLAASDLHHQDIHTSQLQHFLLARDQSKIAGVVGLEIREHFALLRSLAVDPGYRKRGLATQLVRQIEAHAQSSKVTAVYVLTMTAEGFFAKGGYQPTSRASAPAGIQATTEFRSLCPVSAVCMVKHLRGDHPRSKDQGGRSDDG